MNERLLVTIDCAGIVVHQHVNPSRAGAGCRRRHAAHLQASLEEQMEAGHRRLKSSPTVVRQLPPSRRTLSML